MTTLHRRATLLALAMLLVLLNGCSLIAPPTTAPAPILPANATPTRTPTAPQATATLATPASTREPPTATLATTTPPPSAPTAGIPHHDFDIALNAPDRHMRVRHRITVANGSTDTWNEVVLSMPPAHWPGAFTLRQVAVMAPAWHQTGATSVAEASVAATNLDNTMLHVTLPEELPAGETLTLTLDYTLRLPTITPNTWLPKGNLGAGERVIQAGDWHPTLVPYEDGAGWQTWDYHPVGDPTVYPLADYDVRIKAGAGMVIAAPGAVTAEGHSRHYVLRRARAFAFLASPDYHMIEGRAGDISIRVYYLPDHVEGAYATLDTARKALRLYTAYYGPYPMPALVIAENAYYGAMEYSGLVSMSGAVLGSYNGSPLSSVVHLTAHEIAHQWWYGAVGNDQVHEPWLDESFAKYSEFLFYERYQPDLAHGWWDRQVHRQSAGGSLDRTIYDFATTSAYIGDLYRQGGRFMEDLRALLGDEAFFDFVAAYRRYGDGKLVTGEDFFTVLGAYATPEALDPLLRQYFSPALMLPTE